MSATDEQHGQLDTGYPHTLRPELHKALMARGIDYWVAQGLTFWNSPDGRECVAYGYQSNGKPRLTVKIAGITDPEQAIEATLGPKVTGNTSDGYHTFNELYHHRAVLFSVIVRDHRELAWKSMRHHDGTMYDGMFIVGIETPEGQATYHYDIDPYWDMFNCKELDQAPEWDGHTSSEAIERIATLGRGTCHEVMIDRHWRGCSECGYVWENMYAAGFQTGPNYCPMCGAKVVD